jgi:hypothetical protein
MATVAEPAVDVRPDVHVTGLLSAGRRRVTGVQLGGSELPADLVIDAAAIEGRPPAPVPASPEVQVVQDVSAAMMVDADAFRAFLELTFMLALPEDLVSRPGFAGHVRNIAAALPPARFPGPTRQELLAMLS